MKNLVTESGYIDKTIDMVTPACAHGQTPVIPPCDIRMTPIIPTQAQGTPPTHTGLSCKQAQVFDVLIKNSARTTNYTSIGLEVGISKSAARSAVIQLVKKKYISEPVIVQDGVFQGFSYWVEDRKCQHFLDLGGALNEKYLSSSNILTPPIHTACSPSDPSHTHSSRSYLNNRLTTQTIDLNEPELLWWVEQGMTNKQINSWLDQFMMKPDELALSLRYARFDVVINEVKSNGKPIENAQNWIYAILKRAGTYSRPKNYKSIIELRADQLEEQMRKDNLAREKTRELEFEVKFGELMKDRESPLFIELFNGLDEFAKNNQFACEIAMKELFRARYNCQPQPKIAPLYSEPGN